MICGRFSRRAAFLLTLGCMALMCELGWAQGKGKGGGGGGETPPPPPLPGLIYFNTSDAGYPETWCVRPDGSQLTRVLVNERRIPCFYAQGSDPVHDRWYVVLRQTGVYDSYTYGNPPTVRGSYPHLDLFAVRGVPGDPANMELVQLTDLFGLCILSGCDWSLDSNDDPATSFVGIGIRDIRSSFTRDAEGKTHFDGNQSPQCDLRLPLTAGEIQTGWLSNNFVPYRPAEPADLTPLLRPLGTNAETSNAYGAGGIQCLPDGESLLALGGNRVVLLDPAAPDVTQPLRVIWDGNTMGEPSAISVFFQANQAAISPDGTRLAIVNWHEDARGGVWVLTLDGSAPPKQITKYSQSGSNYTEYDQVIWSPDGNHLLIRTVAYAKGKLWFGHVIVPSAGGAAVRTFNPSPGPGWAARWVSTDTAPIP